MADPTLMIGYSELLEEVRTYLGFSSTLTTAQTAVCERIIAKGISNFYRAREWTFGHPTASLVIGDSLTGTVSGTPSYSSTTGRSTVTLTTDIAEQKMVGEDFSFDTSSESYSVVSITSATVLVLDGDASGETADDTFSMQVAAYDLPDNFGALYGDAMFHRADSGYRRIEAVTDFDIEDRRRSTYTGVPQYVAIRAKSTDLSEMQKKEAVFFPTPSGTYYLTYRYTMLNDTVASGYYPIGDSRHRNTIIESCLAAAEQQEDDEIGMHTQLYVAALAQSIEIDGTNEPSNLGYNRDNSDLIGEYAAWNNRERNIGHYYSGLTAPEWT